MMFLVFLFFFFANTATCDVSPSRFVIMLTHSSQAAFTNGQLVASQLHATACLSHVLLKTADCLFFCFPPHFFFCSADIMSLLAAINSAADQHL